MPHKMSRLTDPDRERFRHLRKLGLFLRHFFDALQAPVPGLLLTRMRNLFCGRS
jgi:hypothetical protein